MEEAFHSVYPQADIQRCVVHKIRNLFPKIRVKDNLAFMSHPKLIYTAAIYEQALRHCAAFELKWAKVYPREVGSWKADLPILLTFYKYPEDIGARIYTTNAIVRIMKEIHKRLYPMNSLPNVDAAEMIAYW